MTGVQTCALPIWNVPQRRPAPQDKYPETVARETDGVNAGREVNADEATHIQRQGVSSPFGDYIRQRGNVKRGMTLNYYAHATFQSAQAEMARLEAAKVETTVVAAETTVENTEETKAAA